MEKDESEEIQTSEPSIEHQLKRAREPLDHSPSSTACDPDHAAQDTTATLQTGRHSYTENATFTMEDMPAKSKQWSTLNQANRDFYVENLGDDSEEDEDDSEKKNIRSEQHKQDDLNDTAAWGRFIGLSDYEIERAAVMITSIEEPIKRRHGIEAVILAALTLAANEGQQEQNTQSKCIRPQNPVSEQFEDIATAYGTIRDDLAVEKEAVTACRKHIRANF